MEECELCKAPGEVYLHSRCHIRSPTWAVLSADGKTLRLVCAECNKEITTFQLKETVTHGRA